jgi:hypothetical protein
MRKSISENGYAAIARPYLYTFELFQSLRKLSEIVRIVLQEIHDFRAASEQCES